ncbi:MAG: COG1361 S-layer family protein [Candidatus Woesearchaeota archaeon]
MNKKMIIMLMLLTSIASVSAFSLDVLETDPAPLRAGEYADITVLLETMHSEGVRENLVLRLESTDDVRVLAGQERNIRTMRIGDRYSTTFRVFINEDLPTGVIPIRFILEEDDAIRTIPRDVFVRRGETLPDLFVGSVSSVPSDVIRDSKNNLIRVSLMNLGDRSAELITARLSSSYIKESNAFSLRDTLASLSRGEEGVLEFTFDVIDTTEDSIPVLISLDYRIEDVHGNFRRVSETLDFDLTLKRTPKLEIKSVEALNNIQVGRDSNEVKVTIINTGVEEAEDVRLRLFPDVSYPFDFTRTNYYVSSLLKEGESASIIIDFDVLNTGSVRNYPVNAEIESVVGSARFTEKVRVDIDVTGKSSDRPTIIRNSLLVIAFIIAIFFGVRKYIKKSED